MQPHAPIIDGMHKYTSALLSALALSLCQPVVANTRQDLGALQRAASAWLDEALANSPGIPSFTLSEPDSKLNLPACQQLEIGLPSGYRLMGKTMLRVRCVAGASWSINLPAQISLQVQYVSAARPVAANQTLSEADVLLQKGDLGTLPGSVILDASQAIGRTLNSAIAAGQPIRKEQLRAAMVIQQNQRVKVIFREDGLEINNEGIALGAAAEGAIIRVRVGSNNIISGIAQANGSVLVSTP